MSLITVKQTITLAGVVVVCFARHLSNADRRGALIIFHNASRFKRALRGGARITIKATTPSTGVVVVCFARRLSNALWRRTHHISWRLPLWARSSELCAHHNRTNHNVSCSCRLICVTFVKCSQEPNGLSFRNLIWVILVVTKSLPYQRTPLWRFEIAWISHRLLCVALLDSCINNNIALLFSTWIEMLF